MVAFLQGQGAEASQAVIRGAITSAYEEIATAHRWSFLQRHGRIVVNARQTGTTAVYDHTGGASERLLTVSGDDTLPTAWAEDAAIRFGDDDIVCDIESYLTTTTATLDAQMNPGADVAASSYVLYQRWARLPSDFVAFTGPFGETNWRLGQEISLSEMLGMDRYNSSSGDIRYYAIGDVPDLYGRKALYLYPQMDSTRTIDFHYLRRPRELRFTGHDSSDIVGTVAVTSGSGAVTGTSTVFRTEHVGSIFRQGDSATVAPTGRIGATPFVEERSVSAFTSTTAITLDGNIQTTRSGKKYRITDPIDLGRVAHNAFLRCCEKHLATAKKLEHWQRINDEAEKSLLDAMGADNATFYDPATSLPYAAAWPQGDPSFDNE
ncbi:MAG: hypothetical protein ACYSWU_12180 [Planctomycetota bacterium]|jgi:hypothetical protein